MTEYAFAPLTPALGIRSGSKVSIINPPAGFVQRLNPLPEGVEFLITARTGLDVILFFAERPDELVTRLPALSRAMAVNGALWICWARKEPALLSEEFIRPAGAERARPCWRGGSAGRPGWRSGWSTANTAIWMTDGPDYGSSGSPAPPRSNPAPASPRRPPPHSWGRAGAQLAALSTASLPS